MTNKITPYVLLFLIVRIPLMGGRIEPSLYSDPLKWAGPAKRYSMIISWFGITCVFIASKLFKHNKPLSCIFLVSMVYSFFPLYHGFTLYVICIILGMIWYLHWVQSDCNPLNAICVICLVHLVLLFGQYFGFDPVFHLDDKPILDSYRNVGFFVNINFTSMFIAVCFPAFLRKKWCWFLPLLVAGLVIARSSGGVVAIIAAIIFALFVKKMTIQNKIMLFSMLFFSFSCFYQYVDQLNLSRFEDWNVFIRLKPSDLKPNKAYYNKIDAEKIAERPLKLQLTGLGLESFQNGKIVHRNVNYTHMHNEFLEGYFEFGLIVVPIYLWFFFKLFTGFRKNFLPGMALIIACVISATNYPLHNPTIAAVILVWLALFDRVQSVNA